MIFTHILREILKVEVCELGLLFKIREWSENGRFENVQIVRVGTNRTFANCKKILPIGFVKI
jgi:hypothetical protein